jgi:hypothetical protein
MTSHPDESGDNLPRATLCVLAEVERRLHWRWIVAGQLHERKRYGLKDAVEAAVLHQLYSDVGRTVGDRAWPVVRPELRSDVLDRLELVVVPDTRAVEIAQSDADLLAALPRGRPVVVVDISTRIERVRSRITMFRSDAVSL